MLRIALLLAAFAVSSSASVLFEALPNQQGSAPSDTPDSFYSARMFDVASSVQLGGVEWWGANGSATDTFSIRIFNNNAGNVGSLLNSFLLPGVSGTSTGVNFLGLSEKFYSVVLPQTVPLAAGSYFISIVNESASWAWEVSGSSTLYSSNAPTSGFASRAFSGLSVRLTDTPEPATLGMLSLGILVMILRSAPGKRALRSDSTTSPR